MNMYEWFGSTFSSPWVFKFTPMISSRNLEDTNSRIVCFGRKQDHTGNNDAKYYNKK